MPARGMASMAPSVLLLHPLLHPLLPFYYHASLYYMLRACAPSTNNFPCTIYCTCCCCCCCFSCCCISCCCASESMRANCQGQRQLYRNGRWSNLQGKGTGWRTLAHCMDTFSQLAQVAAAAAVTGLPCRLPH